MAPVNNTRSAAVCAGTILVCCTIWFQSQVGLDLTSFPAQSRRRLRPKNKVSKSSYGLVVAAVVAGVFFIGRRLLLRSVAFTAPLCSLQRHDRRTDSRLEGQLLDRLADGLQNERQVPRFASSVSTEAEPSLSPGLLATSWVLAAGSLACMWHGARPMSSSRVRSTRPAVSGAKAAGRSKPQPNEIAKQVWKLVGKEDRVRLLTGALALLGASTAELFVPPLAAAALFAAIEQGSRANLIKHTCELAVVAACYGLLNGVRSFSFFGARNRFVLRLRERAFNVLINKDMAFYDEFDASELTPRLAGDCQTVFTLLDDALNFFLRSGIITVFGTFNLIRISPTITASVSVVLGLLMACTASYGRVSRSTARRTQDALAELNRISSEGLGSLRTIRALDAEDVHSRLYNAQNAKVFETQRKRGTALALFNIANSGLTTFVRAVALLVGGLIALRPGSPLGGERLAAYVLYLDMVVGSAISLGDEWACLMEALGSGERVLSIVSAPLERPNGTRTLETVQGDVHFNNVTFSYPMRPMRHVVDDVSLHFPEGKTTALVGSSGSGKSSVINLIQRFYDLEVGSITLDGVDVRDLEVSWMRRQLGIVEQEPKLFRGTVAENIGWGAIDATDADVRAAATAACADEFIEALPNGYDQVIGDEKALSGGQRQRIAIARALLRDPPILILDEPTSALDPVAGRLIEKALASAQWSPRLQRNRTIIVIAHRLSTVQHADKIIVLERGKVMESGSHEELVAKGGSYTRFISDQRLPTDHTNHMG